MLIIAPVPFITVVLIEVSVVAVRTAISVIAVIGIVIRITLVSSLSLTVIPSGFTGGNSVSGIGSVCAPVHFVTLDRRFRPGNIP